MSDLVPSQDDEYRQLLFTPCESKEQLARWIRVFLGAELYFPDHIVSDESNSSPMDMIWEVYNKARLNNDEDFSRVMAYANRGGFKCVEKGTLLRLRDQLRPIEDVRVGDEIWTGFSWRKVTDWIHDGQKESRTIHLKGRSGLTVSPIHRVWALTDTGPGWVQAANLKPGDRVALDTKRRFEFTLSQEEFEDGYILGILAGDGCLAFIEKYGHVTLSTVDSHVLGAWEKFCLRLCGRKPKQSKSRPCDWRIHSKEIKAWLATRGWSRSSHSYDKKTPDLRSYSEVAGYLSGLFDTDGFIQRNRLVLAITSKALIEGAELALRGLGIDCKTRYASKLYEGQRHEVHTLWVSAEDAVKLKDVGVVVRAHKAGGFSLNKNTNNPEKTLPRKFCVEFLRDLPTRGGRWRAKKGVRKPNTSYPRFSLKKLERICEYRKEVGLPSLLARLSHLASFDWVEVESVSVGAADFYDLTVEEDHCYWSNGLVSHNTLGASVLEVLQVLHLGRNVAHMAAIFDQSKKSQEYVRDFFAKPYIRDFRVGQNVKKIEICRYYNKETGRSLTEREWLDLDSNAKMAYERKYNYIQIVLCTMQGANSAHTEFLCVDEVDVVPKQHLRAYEEAKHIPDPRAGMMPITLLTSTRKFSYGLVQTEIANSATTGLHVRHWNVIDITQPCQPERHEPEKPKQTYYIDDSNLKHITEEDYKLLDEQHQKKFYPKEGFAGCKKCPLFPACKGRLATHQKSLSTMLKPIPSIINSFKQSSAAAVQTQLLCRKPDASGLIYPKFEREIHMKTASQMAEMITGEKAPEHMTKAQLLQLMLNKGAKFYAGMDFGFTHNFAVTVSAVFGQFMFVFTVIAMPNLELDEKVAVCEPIKPLNPTIFGDPEAPADIKTFKRRGFHMREWDKYKGSVKAGIEVVRMKLMPAVGVPQMFLLRDDPGCELLASRIEKYHFLTDAGGHISEEPDKDEDDECFTEETEVLTLGGWRSLALVKAEDTVLAVDSQGRGFWEHPEAVIRKPFTGTLYKATHNHLEWTATEGHLHQVVSQYDWKVQKKKVLKKKSVAELPSESYWLNNLSSWESGPGLFSEGPDEAWLAGFWLAEGCFDASRPTFLIVDQTKKPQQEKIREVATRLGWRWSETVSGASIRFVFSQQGPRAVFWRKIMGALSHEKKLGVESILAMTSKEREAFWEGYMDGDGCRTGSGWHFDSVSKALAEGMQVLTLSLGYGCRLVSYDCMRAGRLMTNPQGRTYECRQSWRGHVLQKEPVTHLKRSKIEAIQGSCQVYCIRTSKGGFLARTAGKPFVAGNCDSMRYMVMNVFAPKGKINIPSSKSEADDIKDVIAQATGKVSPGQPANFLKEKIASLTGEPVEEVTTKTVRRGRFLFDG